MPTGVQPNKTPGSPCLPESSRTKHRAVRAFRSPAEQNTRQFMPSGVQPNKHRAVRDFRSPAEQLDAQRRSYRLQCMMQSSFINGLESTYLLTRNIIFAVTREARLLYYGKTLISRGGRLHCGHTASPKKC